MLHIICCALFSFFSRELRPEADIIVPSTTFDLFRRRNDWNWVKGFQSC